MNLRQLRYFTRVVEAGNISRAAEQLFVAQPALGLQIRQLEQHLGVALLERHSRGVSVTRAGELLYERACGILRSIEDTERAVVAAGRLESERIVLGLTTGVMSLLGRDIVVAAKARFPSLELSLVEGTSRELMDAMERGELDLAVAYDVHEHAGLLRVPLIEEDLIFVTSPGGQTPLDPPIDFQDVCRHPLVMPGVHDVLRQQLEAAARRFSLPVSVVLDVSSVSARKSIVMHGDAATIMAYCTVYAELDAGRLRGQRIVNPPLRRTLYLMRSRRRAQFRGEPDFVDFLGAGLEPLCAKLGELARPLPPMRGPLSRAIASMDAAEHQERPGAR